MSENEKSEQIGDAMQLLEQQKREVAHLEEKVSAVTKAYRTFASERSRWCVDHADHSKVFLSHPVSGEHGLASYLLSQSELAALITEHKTAVTLLDQTKAKLKGFGITSL